MRFELPTTLRRKGKGVQVEQLEKATRIPTRSYNRMSPIHKLPTEILSDILACGIWPPYESDLKQPTGALGKYQVLIGSVCKLWRAVSQSTPQLWSAWTFIGAESTERSAFHEEMFSLASKRSGEVPTQVLLVIGVHGRLNFSPALLSLARDIVARATEVNIMLLSNEDDVASKAFLPLPHCPRLDKYSLRDERPGPWPHTLSIFNLSLPPPTLREFKCNTRYLSFRLHHIETSNLQSLSIGTFDAINMIGDILKSIPGCHQLRKLTIPMSLISSPQLHSESITSLSLDLHLDQGVNWSAAAGIKHERPLMLLGTFPQLQHLTVSWHGLVVPRSIVFDCPVMPTLQSLSLDVDTCWGIKHVDAFLKRAPNLMALEMKDYWTDDILELLRSAVPRRDIEKVRAGEDLNDPLWYNSLRRLRFIRDTGTMAIGKIKNPAKEDAKLAKKFVRNCRELLELMPRAEVEWYFLPHHLGPRDTFIVTVPPDMQGRFVLVESSRSGEQVLSEEMRLYE